MEPWAGFMGELWQQVMEPVHIVAGFTGELWQQVMGPIAGLVGQF